MGRPLDQESKAFGLFKLSDLYIIIAVFLGGMMLMPAMIRILGVALAVAALMGILFIVVAYFIVANSFPDRMVSNWIAYFFESQFYPAKKSLKKDGK